MDWTKVIDDIEGKENWKQNMNKDIPLFLQNGTNIDIKRVVQDFKIVTLKTLDSWVSIM
jgi:hypothetical protein